MNLKNKIALVTGGTDGLGLSITKCLLKEGCVVHVVSRSGKIHTKFNEKLEIDNLFVHKADVTDYKQIKQVADCVGKIDILINNAGIWTCGKLADVSENSINEIIDINVKGVIFVTKAFLSKMNETELGYIVNISSMAGLKGKDNHSVYIASKFAVTGFTEALSEDLKASNIRVIGFYPGGMNTKMFEKAGKIRDTKGWLDTDEVADVILFVLKQKNMIIDHVVLSKKSTDLLMTNM